jgi:hypothetical protein
MQSRACSSFAEPPPSLAISYCKDTKNNRENQAFPRLFSHKSATQTQRNGSRDDFRFSILIFWGTCTHTQVPVPMTNVCTVQKYKLFIDWPRNTQTFSLFFGKIKL